MEKIEKPKTYTFTKILSYILLFWGIIFTAVGVFSIFDSYNPDAASASLGGFIMGVPTLLGGFLIWKRSYKKAKENYDQYFEELIFSVAKSKNGILNAIEVGMEINVPKAKAEQLLNEMVIKGTAITQVNDNGFVEYAFPVFLKDS